MTQIKSTRTFSKRVKGIDTADGDGVRLTRIIGSPELNMHDPFLLLDQFKNDNPADYIGGFPPHPHRGFETITYMLAGNFSHKDSRGNEGHLRAGSVQWMTAGRGIIHSEMPAQENGLVWGFQLWLNLPARLKMMEPAYQDIDAGQIPEVKTDSFRAKVIAGRFLDQEGPGRGQIPITYLDVHLNAKASFTVDTPHNQNAFLYVIEGTVTDSNQGVCESGSLVTLSNDSDKTLLTAQNENARFIFLSALALNEPVARGGPFVMNSRAEIMQAFSDYESGKIG